MARPLRFPSAMKNVKEGLQQMAHLALRVYLKVHCGHRVRGKARLARPIARTVVSSPRYDTPT